MGIPQKLFVSLGPILLIFLTAIAIYAFQQIRSLSLPIPPALGLFTILLPLITGISTRGAYGLIKRASKKEDYLLTIPLIGVLGFQLIYETVIATLAIGYIVPPSALACGLDQKWLLLYREKDEKAIRAIQDRFNCCGLNSVFDRAFPFSGGRSECSRIFGRDKSCFGEWRQAEQLSAGLFLLVALVVFVIKVLSILSLLTSQTWAEPKWAQARRRNTRGDAEHLDEDRTAGTRRVIEDHLERTERGIEPAPNGGRATEAPPSNDPERGPRLEPSPLLLDTGNEWRNQADTRGDP